MTRWHILPPAFFFFLFNSILLVNIYHAVDRANVVGRFLLNMISFVATMQTIGAVLAVVAILFSILEAADK